jgi:phosphoenolpyruvate carboxylase
MGGDRDGNPNVTPTVTREVCLTNRIRAARLLKEDIGEVAGRLSTTHCNEELRAKVGAEARAPYRRFLSSILDRLDLTIQWATMELNRIKNDQDETILFSKDGKSIDMDDIYVSKQSLLNDLLLVHRSLCETGNEKTANGKVVDVIRKVCAFGLTLVQLDVRQESTRHTMALDAITRYLGIGSYEQWDEATRLSWLQRELVSNRPLIRRGDWHAHPDIFSDTTIDTLETFEMIAEQKDDSLGAYVISQANTASDVLAVLLLQRDAGVKNVLRVVPLFETLDDLNGAAHQMNTLFSIPAYKGVINGKQEVMIGYSDSAKDAGRLAASWAQYETQEQLVRFI